MVRIELEADQLAVLSERASHPDRAVPTERADLEDPPRFDRARQHVQELSLCGRHRDVGQLRAVLDCLLEDRVTWLQQ